MRLSPQLGTTEWAHSSKRAKRLIEIDVRTPENARSFSCHPTLELAILRRPDLKTTKKGKKIPIRKFRQIEQP
jgi:hypothetical protein